MVLPHQVSGKTGVDRKEEELLSNIDLPDQVPTMLYDTVFLGDAGKISFHFNFCPSLFFS
jgi:hypothetical protein